MLLKRHNPLTQCELKTEDDGTFTGYASVFHNDDSDGDTIKPGAFKSSLKDRRPLMLFSHNPYDVIGKYTDIREDKKGLMVTGEFTPGHSVAENVHASLKHGAMDGLSIGFRIPKGGSTNKKEGHGRIIKQVELFEVSIVAMPANTEARVTGVKEDMEQLNQIETIRDVECYLREQGFSRSAAKAFTARFSDIVQKDSAVSLRSEIETLRQQLDTQSWVNVINRI